LIGLRACVAFVVLVFLISCELVAGTQYYRLSYRDDPATTIVVGWCDTGISTNAQVYYRTADFDTNYLNYPLSHGIDRSVDNYFFLNHHFARLTQLTPNTVYYFVVRDDQGISARMCFKTLPDNANTPVSFIAGGDKEKAIDAGCNGYIPKPFNKASLTVLLKSILNNNNLHC
jgi:acid phosphatase type 7